MVVHETAVWILLGACSLAGVAFALYTKLPAATREARAKRVGLGVSAVLDGVGLGLATAFAILVVAAIIARIQL